MASKFKLFANNALLPASDLNSYLMRQVLISVASDADRNALPAPQAGMQVYRADSALVREMNVIQTYTGLRWRTSLQNRIFGGAFTMNTGAPANVATAYADYIQFDPLSYPLSAGKSGNFPTIGLSLPFPWMIQFKGVISATTSSAANARLDTQWTVPSSGTLEVDLDGSSQVWGGAAGRNSEHAVGCRLVFGANQVYNGPPRLQAKSSVASTMTMLPSFVGWELLVCE